MYRGVKLIASLALAGVVLATAWFTALALGNLLNVSYSSTDAGYPAIAVSPDGQNIGIVWAERRTGGGAAQGPIMLKGSTDGTGLSVSITVDNSNAYDDQSWQPDIAVDPITATDMHVVWKNRKNGQDDYIYYANCSLTDSTCQTEQVAVVPDGATGDTFDDPQIAVTDDGSRSIKHVVWRFIDVGAGTRGIQYSGKTGDSGSWTAASTLFSSSSVTVTHPAMAASTDGSQDYLHVVWATDNNIQYIRGTVSAVDGSVAWGSIIPLPMPSGSSTPDYPAVVAMTDTVVVLWDAYTGSDPNEYYAVYMTSIDNGSTFSDGPRDIPTTNSLSFTAHRSDDGTTGVESSLHAKRLQLQAIMVPTSTANITGVVHAVWHETYDIGNGEYRHDVHYAHYAFGNLGGMSLGVQEGGWNNVRVSDKWGTHSAKTYSMMPDIAVDNSGTPYLVYMEGTDDGEYNIINPDNPNDGLKVIDIIYNGDVQLVDNTLGVYLPLIIKNAS